MLPNFIIAGGVATGTSFLSATLANHPDIYLPRIQRPEPNFFHYSWKFDQGLDWYQKSWFHEVGRQTAVGERSSLLLPSEVAPQRIKDSLPSVKLIFCLRNPLERAWGNYRFSVLEGLEPLEFDEAIARESDRMKAEEGKWAEVQPHAYVWRSCYSKCLSNYIKLFGRDRILLLKSEDLGKRPEENVSKVCEFLGVDSSLRLAQPPNYSSPSVIRKELQIELRAYFGERFPEVVECIRKEDDFSRFIVSASDAENIEKLRSNLTGGKATMPQASRQLLWDLLEDEIKQLQTIVDFSVDDWK
jgi:hypothetical protein